MRYPTKHRSDFSEFRKELRIHMTKAEAKLWEKLNRSQLGTKFRRQISIGKYIVDFLSVRPRLVIEVDGSIHEEFIQATKDRERDEILRAIGYIVLRFKNEDIYNHLDEVLTQIKNHLSAQSAER